MIVLFWITLFLTPPAVDDATGASVAAELTAARHRIVSLEAEVRGWRAIAKQRRGRR